jgi:predicted methyltransferase
MKSAPIHFIELALSNRSRPGADFKRDERDSTLAVLKFSGVKPGDVVVDFLPFKGYFTRLFASIVGPSGHVYAAVPKDLMHIRRIAKAKAEIDAYAAAHANVSVIMGEARKAAAPPQRVDLFWTSQNYHDLHDKFMGPVDVTGFNKAVFTALKPGGAYVIVDHAANPGSQPDVTTPLHRIELRTVRKEVESAGLVLQSRSKAMSNRADNRSRRIFERSIRYYTDRFALKFRKPAV